MARSVYFIATFDNTRKVHVTYSKNEAPSKDWKKGLILDQIIITATGRTNWAGSAFKKNISYDLRDYATYMKRKTPLPIENIYEPGDKKGIAIDIVIPESEARTCVMRSSIQETFDAIVEVDKKYTKFGGGMSTHQKPLHKNPELLKKLWDRLEEIQKQKK